MTSRVSETQQILKLFVGYINEGLSQTYSLYLWSMAPSKSGGQHKEEYGFALTLKESFDAIMVSRESIVRQLFLYATPSRNILKISHSKQLTIPSSLQIQSDKPRLSVSCMVSIRFRVKSKLTTLPKD